MTSRSIGEKLGALLGVCFLAWLGVQVFEWRKQKLPIELGILQEKVRKNLPIRINDNVEVIGFEITSKPNVSLSIKFKNYNAVEFKESGEFQKLMDIAPKFICNTEMSEMFNNGLKEAIFKYYGRDDKKIIEITANSDFCAEIKPESRI